MVIGQRACWMKFLLHIDIIAYVFSYCINNVIGINTRMLKVENKDCIGIGVGM